MTAWIIGQQSLPAYAHRFAPKKFTQPQLFACLVLKAFFHTDYRGIVTYLRDMPELCQSIELGKVPHFTTLHKAAGRLLRFHVVRRLLDSAVRRVMNRRRHVPRAAVDSSGFEAGQVSPYFIKRRSRLPSLWQTTTYTRFPKLAIVCDCQTHLILAAHPARGPTPDVNQLLATLRQCVAHVKIDRLIADAGYDSESNHQALRQAHGVITIIPPKHGRPTTKPAAGKYRRLMQRLFRRPERIRYGQRWQVETVFSMIKRNLSHAIAAHTYWPQCREMLLLALTHNVMICFAELRFSTEQVRSVL
jgi:hypothetical protein